MLNEYKLRPLDFKRKIVSVIKTSRNDLLKEEQRFLDMIDKEQFGNKYYNVSSKSYQRCWWVNEKTTKETGEKIRKALTGRKLSEEHIKNCSEGLKKSYKKRKAWNKGLTKEDHPSIKKISEKNLFRESWNKGLTKETDSRIKTPKTAFKKGEKPPKTAFKKGLIPWNAGKKGVMPEPWNKGLTK